MLSLERNIERFKGERKKSFSWQFWAIQHQITSFWPGLIESASMQG